MAFRVRISVGAQIRLFPQRPHRYCTAKLPTQRVPDALRTGVKRPEREAAYANEWILCGLVTAGILERIWKEVFVALSKKLFHNLN
jgi:hypothetical protein